MTPIPCPQCRGASTQPNSRGCPTCHRTGHAPNLQTWQFWHLRARAREVRAPYKRLTVFGVPVVIRAATCRRCGLVGSDPWLGEVRYDQELCDTCEKEVLDSMFLVEPPTSHRKPSRRRRLLAMLRDH